METVRGRNCSTVRKNSLQQPPQQSWCAQNHNESASSTESSKTVSEFGGSSSLLKDYASMPCLASIASTLNTSNCTNYSSVASAGVYPSMHGFVSQMPTDLQPSALLPGLMQTSLSVQPFCDSNNNNPAYTPSPLSADTSDRLLRKRKISNISLPADDADPLDSGTGPSSYLHFMKIGHMVQKQHHTSEHLSSHSSASIRHQHSLSSALSQSAVISSSSNDRQLASNYRPQKKLSRLSSWFSSFESVISSVPYNASSVLSAQSSLSSSSLSILPGLTLSSNSQLNFINARASTDKDVSTSSLPLRFPNFELNMKISNSNLLGCDTRARRTSFIGNVAHCSNANSVAAGPENVPVSASSIFSTISTVAGGSKTLGQHSYMASVPSASAPSWSSSRSAADFATISSFNLPVHTIKFIDRFNKKNNSSFTPPVGLYSSNPFFTGTIELNPDLYPQFRSPTFFPQMDMQGEEFAEEEDSFPLEQQQVEVSDLSTKPSSLIIHNQFHYLSFEEKERFEKMFREIDQDGNGVIDFNDLVHALEKKGIKPTHDNIQVNSQFFGDKFSLCT